jgi:2-phosphosulfolactate phosphatase
MDVRVLHLVDGARAASGAVVVIDVFRAFSLVPYAFAAGCQRVIPVATPEEAFALRKNHPDWLLAGERFTRKLPGFDFGNSPAEIEAAGPGALAGRTLVHTTHAGTQGLVNATGPGVEAVLTGSFVNAAATARFVREGGFRVASLVCMGHQAERPCDEDTACAAHLRALILGEDPPPFSEAAARLRRCESAAKFSDPAMPWTPPRDLELCLALDAVGFAVTRQPSPDGGFSLERAG